jgi:signal transduction histidine kinase
MLLTWLDPRVSRLVRLVGLGLVAWSVITASHGPGVSGRGLVVSILLAACALAWLAWTAQRDLDSPLRADSYVMAAAGGSLLGACPDSASSAFVFVAIVTAGLRADLRQVWIITALAALTLGVAVLIWDENAVGLLAYVLGFAAAALAAANGRQIRQRADQAELLLAQTQRSQEERLRAVRLEESTRIAREIHDVLAHTLAGLTIQLEATAALIENGAGSDEVLTRVRRAHELAREGLGETRRAVGALRDGGEVPVPAALATLADAQSATLTIDGDATRLAGEVGLTVLRVVQESLTNAVKHAGGTEVAIAIDAGEEIVVTVENRLADFPVAVGALAGSGGGYGIVGMRERAQALGGTLQAGATDDGWRVALRVPASAASGGEPTPGGEHASGIEPTPGSER